MTNFKFIDDGFSQMNSEHIFLYGFSYDFNDSLIVEIARKQKAILVTNNSGIGLTLPKSRKVRYLNGFPAIVYSHSIMQYSH